MILEIDRLETRVKCCYYNLMITIFSLYYQVEILYLYLYSSNARFNNRCRTCLDTRLEVLLRVFLLEKALYFIREGEGSIFQ